MANFQYAGTIGGSNPEGATLNVASGTTASIAIGDVVVIANGFAAKVADGGAAAGNGLYGLAVSNSTETSSAAGTVDILYSTNGLIVEGFATTPANLVAAVLFDKCTVDVSGAVQTIDENDAGALLLYKFVGEDYLTTGKIQAVLPYTLAS